MSGNVVVHPAPAWRDRANFLIAARINHNEPDAEWQWEQLWVRQLSRNLFEVCCIPFFVYGICLGDYVTAEIDSEKRYVLGQCVRASGHFSFRIWFKDEQTRLEICHELKMLGCETEQRWEGSRLLAVDAESESLAQRVADLLHEKEQSGALCYETARLS